MNFYGKRILIAEGRARQSLPLSRAFRNLGCNVSALCGSKLDVSYASRFINNKILGVCDNERIDETTKQLKVLIETGIYDLVVPTTDFSASILSKNKSYLSKYTKVASNDWDIFRIASDKLKTMEVCMRENIPCPFTLSEVTDLNQVLNSHIRFPIVVKPRIGYGAIGFKIIQSKHQLVELFKDGNDDLSLYVFQEFIPQTDIQYECAMFMDDNNDVKTSVVFSKNRWFPIDGGSSTLNITVNRPDIVKSCTQLLKAIHWHGAADIDLIQDPRDNLAKIMEINPRVSGSVKICFDAGVNQALQMLELAFGEPVTKYESYEAGCRLRCSQSDLLWFIKSPNRFKASPSWFSCYNTRDQIFTLSDPLPWFVFSLHGLLDYKKEMNKRK
ncbi:ATP-grasp domain-containing protein [Lachnoclostridium pacaense]|uniref:carboxylate--amine ligase n=1 Tax=Enterocloster hominis (ex Hitch et al. 2024) TaxID=1917870 RepID=UPI001D11D861|nr:ATP-grasp domain-containing protein [Lachnoclostridium pacaense]MCC2878083.1 ATP-grasp domain-containing protein [Lachnoclostridium pacaense]